MAGRQDNRNRWNRIKKESDFNTKYFQELLEVGESRKTYRQSRKHSSPIPREGNEPLEED